MPVFSYSHYTEEMIIIPKVMNRTDLTRVIDEKVDEFLQQVKWICEIGPFRDMRRVEPDFSILEPANPEYYEYSFFENSLTQYIRRYLVIGILKELFKLREINCIWLENKQYSGFDNSALEEAIKFEFIVSQDGKSIGHRFTDLSDLETGKLLKQFKLSQIVIVDCSKNKVIEKRSKRRVSLEKHPGKVITVSLGTFFIQYFSDEEYSTYISKVYSAVQEANAEIGFQTIPQLSLRYLSRFKNEVAYNLSIMRFNDLQYQAIDKTSRSNPILSIPPDDNKISYSHFSVNKLYRSLIGNEDFAKCFTTSEYLYNIFGRSINIDYTSVISGYLKSIEMLLHKLMKISLSLYDNRGLTIKQVGKMTRIPFTKENEPNFDITMDPLVKFLFHNTAGWRVSDTGRKVIQNHLLEYKRECRNDHLHKHNIIEFEVAERIRNNTIYLAYLLLGGYILYESTEKNCQELGMADDSFDRLYRKIIQLPRGVVRFVFEFSANQIMLAIRKFTQDTPVYDDGGSLQASLIRFVKVNDFTTTDYDELQQSDSNENDIIISHDNVPLRAWFEMRDGKRVPIEW